MVMGSQNVSERSIIIAMFLRLGYLLLAYEQRTSDMIRGLAASRFAEIVPICHDSSMNALVHMRALTCQIRHVPKFGTCLELD